MKRIIIFTLLTAFLSVQVFSAAEDVDIFQFLYETSGTNQGRLDILQQMQNARLIGAGHFYTNSLQKLVQGFDPSSTSTEKMYIGEMVKILSQLIGQEKYTQAAIYLWRAVEIFGNERMPLVQSEALQALGRIQNKIYLERVVDLLKALNLAPTKDTLTGSQVAFGAILALEKYQDPKGYLPVFSASEGWYTERIKAQARKSLPLISRDPTPFLMKVVLGIGDSYTPSLKLAALKVSDVPGGDPKGKVTIAAAALSQARVSGNQIIWKAAIPMLQKYKAADRVEMVDEEQDLDIRLSVSDELQKLYSDRRSNQDDKKAIIAALSFQATVESATQLAKILEALNTRQRQMGQLNNSELELLTIIIPAIGNTRQPAGRDALSMIERINYTETIKRAARKELEKLPPL